MQFEMFIQTSLPESRLQPVTAAHSLRITNYCSRSDVCQGIARRSSRTITR